MLEPELPADEDDRLAALDRYDILDTLPEEAFEELAELASTLCGTPIALITFVDDERQWYKACIGLDHRETDRGLSFCAHAILEPEEPLVVPDTRDDERFHDNPLVTGDQGIRFYAGAPIVTPDGHALGTVCVLDTEPRDLSEGQIAGLETLASQVVLHLEDRLERLRSTRRTAFLQGVIDALPEHIAILDQAGTIVATNEAWDAFARSEGGEPGPGADYLGAAHEADDPSAREAEEGLSGVLAGERSGFEMVYPCHGPDTERWFEMTATPFETEDGARVVVAHEDITDQKAAQRALEESEQRFREMAEHVDEVFWMIGPSLEEVHFVSPAFESIFGRPREAFYGSPESLIEWIHPEDREAVLDALGKVEAGSQDVRYRIVRPDGSVRRVESRGVPVRDETGQVRRIAGVTRDVTEEEQAQATQRRRDREVARAVELEQLVFATSHTLRTQVRRIKSFSQLLQQRAGEALADRIAEPIGEILEGSSELELLHDALRRYAELTQGGGVEEVVNLEDVAREVIAGRSLEIEGPGGGSSIGEIPTVKGDPEQLRQLLAELVGNAIKFRSELPVELRIEGRDQGATVEVQVQDNGRGFDPAYAERIFSIFQQLEPQTTEGVGIGLTICRRIVENHGGAIRADSEPGKGATFTFTLPAAGDP